MSQLIHGYCFRCGTWKPINRLNKMCPECVTMWLSAKPEERRSLLRVVVTES